MDRSFINRYGGILNEPWEKGPDGNKIKGTWGEDGNEYLITVPSQLRDAILDMQNNIQEKYDEIMKAKEKTQRDISVLNSILGE